MNAAKESERIIILFRKKNNSQMLWTHLSVGFTENVNSSSLKNWREIY
jgi:hypothetical protein